jgi:heptosyltransferase-2
MSKILIIAEWTSNFSEHFQPLVDVIRKRQPNERLHVVFYKIRFDDSSKDVADFSASPFDTLVVSEGRKELIANLKCNTYNFVFVFVKHYVSQGDAELFQIVRKVFPGAVFLFRNVVSLEAFYDRGDNQALKIIDTIRRNRRRATEIWLKIHLLYAVGLILLSLGRIAAPLRKQGGQHRILFMRLDVLGDMVLSLPALLAIRQQFPDSEITVLASKRSGAIVEEQHRFHPNRFCNRIVYWQAPWHEQKGQIKGLVAFFKLLKCAVNLFRDNYDIVVQPIELGTGVFFASLLQGDKTISIIAEGMPLARLMSKHVHAVRLSPYCLYHIADLPKRLALEIGCLNVDTYRHQSLMVPNDLIAEVSNSLREKGWDGFSKVITINIGAGDPKRRWDHKSYAQLLTRLASSKALFPVILGGPGEIELGQAICDSIFVPITSFLGTLNLNQLIALLSLSDIVVTPDTGIMHIAASLDKKIVAIFGAGLVPFCKPQCDKAIIIKHELGCSGCGDSCFMDGKVPCINAVKVDEVYDAVTDLLMDKCANSSKEQN